MNQNSYSCIINEKNLCPFHQTPSFVINTLLRTFKVYTLDFFLKQGTI